MKTEHQINNNLIFSIFLIIGVLLVLAGVNAGIGLLRNEIINWKQSIVYFLTVGSATFPLYRVFVIPRLYEGDSTVVVKKGFKIDQQIPLKQIRVIKRVSAFPFVINNTNMICRYQIEFLDERNEWNSISFFNTLSDQQNILKFIDTIKKENPYLNYQNI